MPVLCRSSLAAGSVSFLLGFSLYHFLHGLLAGRAAIWTFHLEAEEGLVFHDTENAVVFHDSEHVHDGEDAVARDLAKDMRVLCWVMTQPANHEKKVVLLIFLTTTYPSYTYVILKFSSKSET